MKRIKQSKKPATKATRKNVVVVGGAGFIGSNLAHELVAQGYEVFVLDCLVAGKKQHIPKEAHVHEIDICSGENVEKTFQAIKKKFGLIYGVFHLAALPRVQYSIENPIKTSEVNVLGTVHVLNAAHKAGVRRFVYSASSSAYGDQEVMPLHEELPAQPKSPYGLQKHLGELYARLWSEVYGLPTVSLRYFNVYGPRLDPEGPYALVIGRFLKQKKESKPLTITGDGTQTRDFTHVSDVVRANILAMESKKVGKGEVINIGAGRNVSINDLAKMMGGPMEYIPARLEPKHTRADNKKAKALLGWEPKVELEDGIAALKKEWKIK
jgi:UDP-glucose 4-epimerase